LLSSGILEDGCPSGDPLVGCVLVKASTKVFVGPRQSRPDRPGGNVQCGRGLPIAEASPVAESHDLLLFDPKSSQDCQNLRHAALVVQPLSSFVPEVDGLRGRWQFGEQALVAPPGPVGVANGVVRHRQEPRQDGIAVQTDRSPAAPGFEKDDARQLLGCRPRGCSAEAVEVNGVSVSLEQLPEGAAIVLRGSAPQLVVGHLVRTVH
jgi:hypothetical protein